MTGTYPLRSLLAAALLAPGLLLGASPSGCDCGSGPRIPETKAVSDCASSGSSVDEPRARDLTTSMEKLANKFGYSKKQIEDAIHAVKKEAKLRGENVLVDARTGEVYPRTPRLRGLGREHPRPPTVKGKDQLMSERDDGPWAITSLSVDSDTLSIYEIGQRIGKSSMGKNRWSMDFKSDRTSLTNQFVEVERFLADKIDILEELAPVCEIWLFFDLDTEAGAGPRLVQLDVGQPAGPGRRGRDARHLDGM